MCISGILHVLYSPWVSSPDLSSMSSVEQGPSMGGTDASLGELLWVWLQFKSEMFGRVNISEEKVYCMVISEEIL